MPVRNASAAWQGRLRDGNGRMALGSRAFEGEYNFASRFEEGPGTNPDELVGAAFAGCFSMALAGLIEKAGYIPESIETEAKVHLDKVGEGFKITTIELETEARIPEIDEETFQDQAQTASKGCPVGQALAGVDIKLEARLMH